LAEINNTPPPSVAFKQTVERAENLTNSAARLLQQTLAEKKAVELYAQPFADLDRTTQKLLLNRSDVTGPIKDISAASFCRFGRQPEEVRSCEQAQATAKRIVEAIALLAATIKKHLS
jgi:hypothetical protein